MVKKEQMKEVLEEEEGDGRLADSDKNSWIRDFSTNFPWKKSPEIWKTLQGCDSTDMYWDAGVYKQEGLRVVCIHGKGEGTAVICHSVT